MTYTGLPADHPAAVELVEAYGALTDAQFRVVDAERGVHDALVAIAAAARPSSWRARLAREVAEARTVLVETIGMLASGGRR